MNEKAADGGSGGSSFHGPERLLSGLRGVLITWVMAQHFMDWPKHRHLNRRFAANTYLFVMLSGFSLTLSYLQAKGRVSWVSYFRSKAVGLFPVYYLALLLSLPLYISIRQRPVLPILGMDYSADSVQYLWDALLNLTAEQGWVQQVLNRSLPSLYYASIQWNLYLFLFLHVTVASPIIRTIFPCFSSDRPYLTYGALTVVAIGVLQLLVIYVEDRPPAPFLLLRCYPYFLMGTAMGGFYHSIIQQQQQAEKPLPTTALIHNHPGMMTHVVWRGMIVLLLGLSTWLIADTKNVPLDESIGDHIISFVVLPLFWVGLLLLLLLQPFHSLLKTALETEALVTLGNISFALYLFHLVIGGYYGRMAVDGWTTLLAPPSVSSMELLMNTWIMHQSPFFKAVVMLNCIVFSWFVQRFIVDKYLMPGASALLSGECWMMMRKERRSEGGGDIANSGGQEKSARAADEEGKELERFPASAV